MIRYVFIFIFLLGCKTTKRVESTKSVDSISFETSVKKDLFEIKRSEDLTEVITETIRKTPVIIKNESGEESIVEETVTEKKTERFKSLREEGSQETEEESDYTKDESVLDNNLQRETEGQEVAKDITKGITEGIFKSIFGDFFKYATLGAVILITVIVVLKLTRKKSQP